MIELFVNHTTYCSSQLIVNTPQTRQRLEMPHFSIVTKIFTTQRLTREKSVLRLFEILGGIHSKLENYGFHKQNFDYFRF